MKVIGIVKDGYSDFMVLKKFIHTIFSHHKSINLEDDIFYEYKDLKLINSIEKFAKSSKEEDFIKEIGSILFTAYNVIAKENTITNKDIIVLNTDSEKILGQNKEYFEDWAYILNQTLFKAIEQFNERMINYGYKYENIPLILPLVLFPSSEIIVAASMYDFCKDNCRKLKPNPDLKVKVYSSADIPTIIENGNLQNVLDTFVIPDHLSDIYKEIPEVRSFMHVLSHP